MDTYKCSMQELDFGEHSVLCYLCMQKLGKWAKHEKEIVQIRQQIVSFLLRFRSAPSRKRSQPTEVATELHTPERKRSKSSQIRTADTSKVLVSITLLLSYRK